MYLMFNIVVWVVCKVGIVINCVFFDVDSLCIECK